MFSADFRAGEASLRVCHDHKFHGHGIMITSPIRISQSASAENSFYLELDLGDSGRAGRIDGLNKRIGTRQSIGDLDILNAIQVPKMFHLDTRGVAVCLCCPLQVNNWHSTQAFLLQGWVCQAKKLFRCQTGTHLSQESDLSLALLAGVLACSSLVKLGSG